MMSTIRYAGAKSQRTARLHTTLNYLAAGFYIDQKLEKNCKGKEMKTKARLDLLTWFRSAVNLTILLLLLFTGAIQTAYSDSTTTTQVGQGVVLKRFVFDNLFNSKQRVFLIDVDLNDPRVAIQFRVLNGGMRATVSTFATGIPDAAAAINAQFFNAGGVINFLRVDGITIAQNDPSSPQDQAVVNDDTGTTSSVSIMLRPAPDWNAAPQASVMACGPRLFENGVRVPDSAYDMSNSLIGPRHPRTAVGWTNDNHLLLLVVDGRSTIAAGMSIPELRDTLAMMGSIRNGFNFDGGGSSTLWARDSDIVNQPSDGHERPVPDAIVIIAPPPF